MMTPEAVSFDQVREKNDATISMATRGHLAFITCPDGENQNALSFRLQEAG
jgi:hypothetical protein